MIWDIVSHLRVIFTITLTVHGFGLMRKQNIEKPLPWSRTTCGVGLIADITVFCQIVCSFEIKFELATFVTQSFHIRIDGACRTQFFCYICALDVDRAEVHLMRFLTIFRVRKAHTVTKMVNTHILRPAIRDGDL